MDTVDFNYKLFIESWRITRAIQVNINLQKNFNKNKTQTAITWKQVLFLLKLKMARSKICTRKKNPVNVDYHHLIGNRENNIFLTTLYLAITDWHSASFAMQYFVAAPATSSYFPFVDPTELKKGKLQVPPFFLAIPA